MGVPARQGQGGKRRVALSVAATLTIGVIGAGSALGGETQHPISPQKDAQNPKALHATSPNAAAAMKAQQAREEWLDSAEAEQERQASVSAYTADGRAGIEQVLQEQFADFLESNEQTVDPEDIERFTSDFTAIVDIDGKPGGRKSLAVSSDPLRVASPLGGPKEAVDSSLEWQGGELSPEAPLVDFSLPGKLGQNIDLPDGVSLDVPTNNPQVAPSLVGEDTALYPNVATDTDFVAAPVPGGIEVSNLLRSPQSPETQDLRFQLPAGASLRPTEGGGAEIMRGGVRLLGVSPTIATDAQGQNVPVTTEVTGGNTLRINVPHRAGDWAYPILVDPWVWDDYQWASGSTRYTGWTNYNYGNFSLANSCMYGYACWGNGLFVYSWQGQYYGNGAQAGFQYAVPGVGSRSTYIYHVGISPIYHYTQNYDLSPYFTVGLYAPSCNCWPDGANWYSAWGNGLELWAKNYNNQPTRPKYMNIGQYSNYNLVLQRHHVTYIGAITMELTDEEAPVLDPLVSSTGAPRWVNQETGTIPLHARDPGLGVKEFMSVVPNKNIDANRVIARHSQKCINVFPGDPRDGVLPVQWDCQLPSVRQNVFDFVPSSSGYFQLVAQHSGKCLDVAGASGANGARVAQYRCLGPNQANQQWRVVSVGGGYKQLRAKHSDQCLTVIAAGAANNVGLEQYPCVGAQNQEWTLDRVGYGNDWTRIPTTESPACTGANGNMCPVDGYASAPYNTEQMPEGISQVEVAAYDAVGDATANQGVVTAIKQTKVLVDRTGPEVSASGGLLDPNVPDYQIRVDALDHGDSSQLRTARSGVKSIELLFDGQRADFNESPDCNGQAMQQTPPIDMGSCDMWLADTPPNPTTLYGNHQLRVVAKDRAGNTTTWDRSINLPDRLDPTLEVSGELSESGSWLSASAQALQVEVADGGSGAATARVRIDGQQVASHSSACSGTPCTIDYEFGVDLSGRAAGPHQVEVIGEDAAGRTTTRTWTVRVDPTPPLVTLSGDLKEAENTTLSQMETYGLTVAANDGSAGAGSGTSSIQVRMDGEHTQQDLMSCNPECPTTSTRSFDVSPLDWENGHHTLQVIAMDDVGNSVSKEVEFDISGNADLRDDPTCPEVVDGQPVTNPTSVSEATSYVGEYAPEVIAPSQPTTDPVLEEAADAVAQDPPDLPPGAPEIPEVDPTVNPSLDGSHDELHMDGTTPAGESSVESNGGIMVGGAVCIAPIGDASNASNGSITNGDSALFANTDPSVVRVVRPAATGIDIIEAIRSSTAPQEFKWKVGLKSNQNLVPLENGGVAVVETVQTWPEDPPETEADFGGLPLPPPRPPNADTVAEIPDAATQLVEGRYQLGVSAGLASVGDQTVIAVFPAPWARDSSGTSIPATLSVDGNMLTLTVSHWSAPEPPEYPIVADLDGLTDIPLQLRTLFERNNGNGSGEYSPGCSDGLGGFAGRPRPVQNPNTWRVSYAGETECPVPVGLFGQALLVKNGDIIDRGRLIDTVAARRRRSVGVKSGIVARYGVFPVNYSIAKLAPPGVKWRPQTPREAAKCAGFGSEFLTCDFWRFAQVIG